MDFAAALAYLDEHASYDKTGRVDSPSVEPIARLCSAMGDPQHAMPVIHVTGTNGKGSTVQMISRLLIARGLDGRHLHQPAPRTHQRTDQAQR